MASGPKATSKLGYEHYVCFPDDGRRHEIINGVHFVNPAPSTYHQTVSKRLQHQLYTKIELEGLGILFDAPVDVQLSDHDIIQPDLVVVLNEKKTIITPTKVKGIPDLIVEILSLSSIENDRNLKRELYQNSGVLEYWIVDPFEHTVDQLLLQQAKYQLQQSSDEVRLMIVQGISVDLTAVW